MTGGLVYASYSLPEWQAVKLTFFAPCNQYTLRANVRVNITNFYQTYSFLSKFLWNMFAFLSPILIRKNVNRLK